LYYFIDNNWKYLCKWHGNITKFEGHEKILFKKEIVFTHDFLGGLIITPKKRKVVKKCLIK